MRIRDVRVRDGSPKGEDPAEAGGFSEADSPVPEGETLFLPGRTDSRGFLASLSLLRTNILPAADEAAENFGADGHAKLRSWENTAIIYPSVYPMATLHR